MKKKIETKRKKKKRSYKVLIFILSLTFVAAAAVGVFYGAYYYIMNQSLSAYDKSIKSIVLEIGQSNKAIGTFVKDKSIDPELIKKELPKQEGSLVKIKDKLEKLTPPSKQKLSQEHLAAGLNNNILLYRQLLVIVKSPESKDISKSISEFKKYNNEMLNGYSLFENKSYSILLPKEALDFINMFSVYANQLVDKQKQAEVRAGQLSDYSNKMRTVIDNFTPLKTDFGPSLQKERAENGNFDSVLEEIDDAKTEFKKLKKDFDAVTPPKDAQAVHSSFRKVLNEYDSFLQELRYAVSNEKEKAKDEPMEGEQLKSNYSSSNAKFAALTKKYEDFMNAFSALK